MHWVGAHGQGRVSIALRPQVAAGCRLAGDWRQGRPAKGAAGWMRQQRPPRARSGAEVRRAGRAAGAAVWA